MNPLYKEIIGSWVRAALVSLSAFLVQRHIVTEQQGESLIAMWFDQIINALPGIVALVWSWWQKHSSRKVLNTALTLPAGVTEDQVRAYIASGATVPTVNTPSNTVPGIPKP